MEYEGDGDTNCNWCTQNSHQRIVTRDWKTWKRGTSRDHPNNSIAEIGQNTEKSPGDQRRLALTRSPVGKHRLTLM